MKEEPHDVGAGQDADEASLPGHRIEGGQQRHRPGKERSGYRSDGRNGRADRNTAEVRRCLLEVNGFDVNGADPNSPDLGGFLYRDRILRLLWAVGSRVVGARDCSR